MGTEQAAPRGLVPDLGSYLRLSSRGATVDGNKQDEYLTAAECAARTGLTVRALRVYERYGLIAPPRTAGQSIETSETGRDH
jgi:hypothetical protein